MTSIKNFEVIGNHHIDLTLKGNLQCHLKVNYRFLNGTLPLLTHEIIQRSKLLLNKKYLTRSYFEDKLIMNLVEDFDLLGYSGSLISKYRVIRKNVPKFVKLMPYLLKPCAVMKMRMWTNISKFFN